MSAGGLVVEGEDSREFESFFVHTSNALVAMAYALTGNGQEAQDLAQEALIRVWERWPVISRYEDPPAWARRVLFNLAISRLRRLRLERRPTGETATAAPPSPDAVDLAAALRRLPGPQRKALVLREVVDLDVEEIAKEMGTTAGTVRKWLFRARSRLASELAATDARPVVPSVSITPTEVRNV